MRPVSLPLYVCVGVCVCKSCTTHTFIHTHIVLLSVQSLYMVRSSHYSRVCICCYDTHTHNTDTCSFVFTIYMGTSYFLRVSKSILPATFRPCTFAHAYTHINTLGHLSLPLSVYILCTHTHAHTHIDTNKYIYDGRMHHAPLPGD
jgi:hypothetical protein